MYKYEVLGRESAEEEFESLGIYDGHEEAIEAAKDYFESSSSEEPEVWFRRA